MSAPELLRGVSQCCALLALAGSALAQTAPASPQPAAPPSDAPDQSAQLGGRPGQFYLPPGEPVDHKLLSPIMHPPPGGGPGGGTGPATTTATPPADPRNFEGAYTKTVGYNAYTPADRKDFWDPPPFTPEAARIFWNRVSMENHGTPVADAGIRCEPMGLGRAVSAEFGWRMLQSPKRITWLINEDHLVRRIEIGAQHPAHLKPSFMGNSVAHWEGDTLVVDTIGFNDKTWLDFDGEPHSAQLHVVERLRKIEHNKQLEDLMTIQDPVMYTHPWNVRMVYAWAPITETGAEIICEENDVELSDYTGKDLQQHQP